MNYFIKNMNRVILLVVFLVTSMYSSSDCLSKYKCDYDMNGTKIMGIKSCSLPKMNTFTITALNIVNSDGSLKKYFARYTSPLV